MRSLAEPVAMAGENVERIAVRPFSVDFDPGITEVPCTIQQFKKRQRGSAVPHAQVCNAVESDLQNAS